MKTVLMMTLLVLVAACQSADVDVVQPTWPEGTTAAEAVAIAEAMPEVTVVQVVNYGSAEATAAVAQGVQEAVPAAVSAQTGEVSEDPAGEVLAPLGAILVKTPVVEGPAPEPEPDKQ